MNLKTTLSVASIPVLALLAYLVWLPRVYTGDDLQYAIVIERAVAGATFYHPAGGQLLGTADTPAGSSGNVPEPNVRYLLEYPTSISVARVWGLFGWDDGVIMPILFLRAMAGSLGILSFFLAISSLVGGLWIPALASLGLATSTAYWTYSTHLDQSINMVALACTAFYLLVKILKGHSKPRDYLLLVLTLAAATFFNLTAMLLALAAGLTLFALVEEPNLKVRLQRLAAFWGAYGVLLLGGIVLALVVWGSPSTVLSAKYWNKASFAGHPEYSVSFANDAMRAVLGFAKSEVAYPGVPGSLQEHWDASDPGQRALLIVFYGIVLAGMSIPLALGLHRLRRGRPRGQGFLFPILVLALFSGFNIFWDPGYMKYWLVPLLAWWAIVALGLFHLETADRRTFKLALGGVALFVAFSFAVNLSTVFVPSSNRQAQAWEGIALALRATEPTSLFISPGHPLDFYIAYFARRSVLSTGLVSYAYGGDENQARQVIQRQLERERQVHGKVYVYGTEGLDEEELRAFVNLLGPVELVPAMRYGELTFAEALAPGR